jgi:hypothetical protein
VAPYAGRYRVPNATTTVPPQEGALLLTTEPSLVPGQVGQDVSTTLASETLELRAQVVRPDLAVVTAEELSLPIPFVRRAGGSAGRLSVNVRLVAHVEPA